MNRTVKLKGTNLFSKERWAIVRNAVSIINRIVSKASMLAKLYVLSTDEIVPMDESFYDICFKVVSGEALRFRKEMTPEKLVQRQLYESLKLMKEENHIETVDLEGLSLSQSLGYAAAELETAVLNNIEMHYEKHAKRYCMAFLGDKKLAWGVVSHLLYGGNVLQGTEAFIDQNRSKLSPERTVSFDTDVKQRPWLYVRHAIRLSMEIEAAMPRERLLSPVPIRRSWIPKHVQFDTNALVQLLMDKKEIEDFVLCYEGEKPKLRTKADLGNSFQKVFGRAAVSESEDFDYQTSFWKHLCRLDHPRYKLAIEREGLYFGNSIRTDGCSVSLLLVSEKKKKEFKLRKNAPKRKPEEFETVNKMDPKTKKLADSNKKLDPVVKYFGVDPGKRDLIAVSDGKRTFKYTAGERKSDCEFKKFERRNVLARQDVVDGIFEYTKELLPGYYITLDLENPTLQEYESEVLSLASSKSSTLETFSKYVKSRMAVETKAVEIYSKPRFRNDRFSKYALCEASTDRMLNRLEKFLEGESEKTPRDCHDDIVLQNYDKPANSKIALFYGNWGRTPNLRNSAPTPGISLRRRIHKRFETLTVEEHYTSKTCPCCKTRTLDYATLEGPDRDVKFKHSLLVCQNCGRLWNRNVVGSYNILALGLQAAAASA